MATETTTPPDRAQAAKPRLFDRPLVKDWIVWLVGIAIIAGISGVMSDYNSANTTLGATAGMTGSEVIDLAFAVAFQFFLFGVLPANIRRGYRKGRSATGA